MDETKAPELKRRAVEHAGADGGPIETQERAAQLDYSRLTVEELRVMRELVLKATPAPTETELT